MDLRLVKWPQTHGATDGGEFREFQIHFKPKKYIRRTFNDDILYSISVYFR